MSKMNRVFDYILLCIIVILVIWGYVFIGAVVSMLLCNWILPVFDLGCPLTFRQGCGIGVIIFLVAASGFYHNEIREQS